VLIETRTLDLTALEAEPPAELTAELAWCLRRFVMGRADESAMRRAEQALRVWEDWSERAAVEPPG
jgi:hypothetical protein